MPEKLHPAMTELCRLALDVAEAEGALWDYEKTKRPHFSDEGAQRWHDGMKRLMRVLDEKREAYRAHCAKGGSDG
jgi:hypothetical protein